MINDQADLISSTIKIDSGFEPDNVGSLYNLPEEPLIKIRTGDASGRLNLKDLWAHRELLYFLIWRDLKVRYKQTMLGATWVILQPLLMTIVFTIFMSRLARVPSDGVLYPLFAYAGLLPWLFFSNAAQSSSQSLIANSYIITKVYFPRLIIPAAIIGVRLVDFLVSALMLFILMLYYGVHLSSSILIFPFLIVQVTLLALGFGLWFSILNARYRDFGSMLSVLLQLWMFASPIIYPSNLVPERWYPLYACNPLVGIVEGVRASTLGMKFHWSGIAISAIITLSLLAYGTRSFCRMEEKVIDIL